MKKKGIKRFIPWVVLGLLALLLALLPVMARESAAGAEASVLQTTAISGEIKDDLAGGGMLTAEDPVKVEVPEGIEITEFLVENGEHVEEGQPIAKVDRVTLMEALLNIQTSLEDVSDDMQAAADTATARNLNNQAAGRVKAVYAQVDDDVRTVMLRDGALALVSLDGLMVTEIRTDRDVAAGAKVHLRLPDGTEKDGRVETVLEGTLRITLSDDGPVPGDSVTAFSESGEELGVGTLSVHSPWKLLATDGVVSQVYAKENQKIQAGAAMMRVRDLSGNAEYQALAAKHREYEEMMQKLFAMYEDDCIKAPCTGFVSGIDKKLVKKTASLNDREVRLVLLSNESGDDPTNSGSEDPDPVDPENNIMTSYWIGIIKGIKDGKAEIIEAVPLGESGEAEAPTTAPARKGLMPGAIVLIEVKTDISTEEPTTVSTKILMVQNMSGKIDINIAGIGVAQPEEPLFSTEENTILSVTPDNAMTISITVDELDILQYELGMKADVTVDALPDRSFSAEVTDIDAVGSNSGGSSKFQVKLRLDRAPDMLDGMNASVVIHKGSRTALLIPAAAIHDRGSRSYVYTALDNKTGKPTLEVPVETGLSDGESVEILSGLAENQPVFYEYYNPPAK